jgi:hypothetical protein
MTNKRLYAEEPAEEREGPGPASGGRGSTGVEGPEWPFDPEGHTGGPESLADEMDDGNEYEDDDDDEGDDYLDPFDAGMEPDARGAVAQWKIVAVGHRPEDFLARDCLYASLARDHRVPWFRRYLKKPADWMEALTVHLKDKADRRSPSGGSRH